MPTCQAYGCSNTSGKTVPKHHYFRIPNPEEGNEKKLQAKRWLHNIGTEHTVNTFKFNRSKVVCSDHFHPMCFKDNKVAIMLGYMPSLVYLKEGAVPTIFKHKMYSMINMNGEVAIEQRSAAASKRLEQKEHEEIISKLMNTDEFVTSNTTLKDKDSTTMPSLLHETTVSKTTETASKLPPNESSLLHLISGPSVSLGLGKKTSSLSLTPHKDNSCNGKVKHVSPTLSTLSCDANVSERVLPRNSSIQSPSKEVNEKQAMSYTMSHKLSYNTHIPILHPPDNFFSLADDLELSSADDMTKTDESDYIEYRNVISANETETGKKTLRLQALPTINLPLRLQDLPTKNLPKKSVKKIRNDMYLLHSSHSWLEEEKLLSLCPSLVTSYSSLLMQQNDVIKVEQVEEEHVSSNIEKDSKLCLSKQKIRGRKIYKARQQKDTICRLCGKTFCQNYGVSLVSKRAKQMNLINKINHACGVAIDERDHLPKSICRGCNRMVDTICEFRTRCQSTQLNLTRSFVNSTYSTKKGDFDPYYEISYS